MRVSNEDRSPARIHGCDTAPTPTGFAEIVSDHFPVFRQGLFAFTIQRATLIKTHEHTSDFKEP